MCDIYRKSCFGQKIFTNGLNMDLPQQAWVEKSVHGVKTLWLSGK